MAPALTAILLSLTILISQIQLGQSAKLNPIPLLTKRAAHHSLHKRGEGKFPGRATFYDPGLGACGQTNGPGDFIVALNQAQYTANKWCNKKIKIFFGGKSTEATIVDECPGCPENGLDMSPSLFEFFASKDVGVFYMDEDDPPAKDQDQPPPKKENSSQPPKDDPPPAYKIDNPPQYTSTPSTTFGSQSNPFTAFQSNPNLPSAAAGAASVARPNIAAAAPPSIAPTFANPTPITNPISFQPVGQINPIYPGSYAPGGNLDAINQLIISFGSLAAASAGNALNNQS
ncbi:hypothetical protein PtB15_7B3 [Puccinia triticina]|nr:hypothetical protein PtB15_7B3 [Puccinia triticina]